MSTPPGAGGFTLRAAVVLPGLGTGCASVALYCTSWPIFSSGVICLSSASTFRSICGAASWGLEGGTCDTCARDGESTTLKKRAARRVDRRLVIGDSSRLLCPGNNRHHIPRRIRQTTRCLSSKPLALHA